MVWAKQVDMGVGMWYGWENWGHGTGVVKVGKNWARTILTGPDCSKPVTDQQ